MTTSGAIVLEVRRSLARWEPLVAWWRFLAIGDAGASGSGAAIARTASSPPLADPLLERPAPSYQSHDERQAERNVLV